MYTRHGHQIQGTPVEGPTPSSVARCGGPGLCGQCSQETVTVGLKKPLTIITGVDEPKISQIPPAPMSEEDLRLEAVSLAVEWSASITNMTTAALLLIADDIKDYIRPKEES